MQSTAGHLIKDIVFAPFECVFGVWPEAVLHSTPGKLVNGGLASNFEDSFVIRVGSVWQSEAAAWIGLGLSSWFE